MLWYLSAMLFATLLVTPPGYEQAVNSLPPTHWALVTRVDAVLPSGQGHTFGDRRIEVPRQADAHVLIHEVGHVIAIVRPDLEDAYWTATEHGKLDQHESFAEAYRAAVEGRPHRAAAWMREYVLVPIALPSERPVAGPQAAPASNPVFAPIACPGAALLPSGAIVHGCALVPSGSVR